MVPVFEVKKEISAISRKAIDSEQVNQSGAHYANRSS